MNKQLVAIAATAFIATLARAEDTKVAIGISGWTGFAPLTLAKEAGLFQKRGLDVSIKKIPQKDRHLAIASGDVQCAATTVETWIGWNAAGVATTQIFQLDKSYGADGMVTKPGIAKITDLKGKTVAASPPGTSPYFALAWMLKKNGMSVKDVKVVNLEPQPAANAIIAGTEGVDAGMTYEPYLSAVRAKPEAGRIIATTLDYPMVMDTFGCTPKFLAENPKAAKALADGYFDALEMIKADPEEELRDHGRRREAVGRGLREEPGLSALAGPRRQPEVLRRRACGLQQGSRRPAARGRHHQAAARHDQARRHAVHQVTMAARRHRHPERSEGSRRARAEILRCAQDDRCRITMTGAQT